MQGVSGQPDPIWSQVLRRSVAPVVGSEGLLAVNDVDREGGASQEESEQIPCLVRGEVPCLVRRWLVLLLRVLNLLGQVQGPFEIVEGPVQFRRCDAQVLPVHAHGAAAYGAGPTTGLGPRPQVTLCVAGLGALLVVGWPGVCLAGGEDSPDLVAGCWSLVLRTGRAAPGGRAR